MLTSRDVDNPSACDLSTVAVPSTSDASNRLYIIEEVPIPDHHTITESYYLTPQCLSVNTDQITTTIPSPTRSKKEKERTKERAKEYTVDENDGNALNSDDESTICLECTEFYVDSVPGEQWVQCITCKLWAHSKCVRGNLMFFECKHCTSDIED
ncbi:unnamed protein product [Euphydryas editha]|uniref:Zinc finger PHD-type domain-containing protein n=1 Tax=Euphydryas editha TaxID=104508 RepID=A0AAU9TSJ6_EUPED|nr:unnamed protein product [Euphydryas editha]